MPLWGRFCDLWGRRNSLIICMVFFVGGSIGCALSADIIALVVLRAVQGVGGGGIMSVVLIVLADMVPPSERSKWLAPLSSMVRGRGRGKGRGRGR